MAAAPEKLKIVKELGRKDILFSVARRPQTSHLFAGSSDGNIYELDVLADEPQVRELAGHESYVTGLALAGRFLVSGGYDGRLVWWDVETGQQVRAVDAHTRWIRGVVANRDGKWVASAADDMVCRLWDVESGELRGELRGHAETTPHHFPSMLYACAFSADGKRLATADRVGHVVVWEVESGKQLATLDAPLMYTWDPKARIHSIGGIRSLAFSADGSLLAAGGIGQIGNIDHLGALARVEIFDWRKGERTHEFPGDKYKGLVERLVFDPDGKWLLAAGGDHGGFLQFLDLGDKKIIKQEKAPMHVHDLALNETADTIYAVGHGKVVVWEMKDDAAPPE